MSVRRSRAARVVHRSLAQPEIGEETAVRVDREQVADPFARIAIVAAGRLRQAPRRDLHFHGRQVERVSDFDHPLRVVGRESHRHRRHQRPRGVPGEALDAVGDGRSGVVWRRRQRGRCGRERQRTFQHTVHARILFLALPRPARCGAGSPHSTRREYNGAAALPLVQNSYSRRRSVLLSSLLKRGHAWLRRLCCTGASTRPV